MGTPIALTDYLLLAQRGARLLRGLQHFERAAKNHEAWVYWVLAAISLWLLGALIMADWKSFIYFTAPASERREVQALDAGFFVAALNIAASMWIWITIVKAMWN